MIFTDYCHRECSSLQPSRIYPSERSMQKTNKTKYLLEIFEPESICAHIPMSLTREGSKCKALNMNCLDACGFSNINFIWCHSSERRGGNHYVNPNNIIGGVMPITSFLGKIHPRMKHVSLARCSHLCRIFTSKWIIDVFGDSHTHLFQMFVSSPEWLNL